MDKKHLHFVIPMTYFSVIIIKNSQKEFLYEYDESDCAKFFRFTG